MENNPYLSNNMNLSDRTRNLHNLSQNNQESLKANYHGYNTYPEMDNEYASLLKQKKLKKKSGIINLTSEELKKEYENKNNYLKSYMNIMFLISILSSINSIIEFKYLRPAEKNAAIMILSFISAGLCFVLIVNLNANALIDSFGYQAFYFFAIFEFVIFLVLFVLKFYNFVSVFKELYASTMCKNKIRCPKFSSSIYLFIFNCVIIICQLICVKFIWNLFLEGFRILMKKEKTLFERQLELNLVEKNERNMNKEFVEEERLDSNRENSRDNMKID